MIGLAVFGWVVLVLIALYATFASVYGTYICIGFGGRVESAMFIFYLIAFALWVIVWNSAPFKLVVQ